MKMTQAWGWLAAGVLAAGLNASYHDGGLQWAHRVADQVAENVEHNSAAVLALASGHADRFLAEARMLTARDETASCRLATALARVQTKMTRAEAGFDRFEAMSAREEAQLARLEADRARMEAQVAVRTAHLRMATAAFDLVAFKAIKMPVACPRLRVNIPRLPTVRIPAPVVHVEMTGLGPV